MSSITNSTQDDEDSVPRSFKVFAIVVLFLIAVLGFCLQFPEIFGVRQTPVKDYEITASQYRGLAEEAEKSCTGIAYLAKEAEKPIMNRQFIRIIEALELKTMARKTKQARQEIIAKSKDQSSTFDISTICE